MYVPAEEKEGKKKKGFVLFVYPPEASSGSKDAVELHPAIDGNLLFLYLLTVSNDCIRYERETGENATRTNSKRRRGKKKSV